MTVRSLELIACADVFVHDGLIPGRALDSSSRPDAIRIDVGKRPVGTPRPRRRPTGCCASTARRDGRSSGSSAHMPACLCKNARMGQGHHVGFNDIDSRTAEAVAETMQALAVPRRVKILSRLAVGACSVTELAQAIEMGQPAVSQQLRVLRYLGLVVGTRQGRRIVYALHDDHVRVLLTEAISHTEHIRLGSRTHAEVKAVTA